MKHPCARFAPVLQLAVALMIGFGSVLRANEPTLKPDLVVAADGSGQFTSVQAAIASIPASNRERMIVLIKRGTYREKVRIDAAAITLRGEDRDRTRIEFPQGSNEYRGKPDGLGVGVVNINGDDCVIENLTIENTHGVIGVHAFAVFGRGDRTVIQDCNVLSQGNDTLSLWRTADREFDRRGAPTDRPETNGRYYHARLKVRGSVDFICPRGWCYLKDSEIYEVNPNAEAAIWHDGSRDRSMKFVLRNCRLDGVEGWRLGRNHHDAQIFLLDCTFSSAMRDHAPHRVIYPLGGKPATEADHKRNAELERTNIWGHRYYYWNTHRQGGDYAWHADNLATAAGSPKPDQMTAAWTFDGRWDPENPSGPHITKVAVSANAVVLTFSESVTVKGKPQLVLKSGRTIACTSGSGTADLHFVAEGLRADEAVAHLDTSAGAIIATEAAATLRFASARLP